MRASDEDRIPTLDPSPGDSSESILLTLIAIAFCLLGSFLFAGSETAITSMGEHRIRKLIELGQRPVRFFECWLDDHSGILTTLLAGNTMVNITASAMTTTIALDFAAHQQLDSGTADLLLAGSVFCLSMLVLVWGEIAPKTLAKSRPETFVPFFILIWWFHLASRWLTRSLTWIAKTSLRLVGVDASPIGFVVTEEHIEDMVRIGSEEGSIDEERGDMLQGVLELSDISVRSIMTPRTGMVSIALTASLTEVLETISTSSFSRYPVYDGNLDKIVGIFYTRDLIQFLSNGKQDLSLSNRLHEVMFVPESKKASVLLGEFQQRAVHMAIVVDEHGGTDGIVTLEDILEELVGEIYDEYDEREQVFAQKGPNTWIVDARAEIRELDEELDIEFPESESYSTVGGFVVEQLGRVPQAGEHMDFEDLRLTVLDADDKRVVQVEIERMTSESSLIEPD